MSVTPKILIVEDDGDLAAIIFRFLESEGFSPTIAGSAEVAYDLLAKETFDAIVLDVNLPGDDGFSLCRQLRRVSGVPVIFASARAGEDVRAIALEGGGDAYLPKPYSMRELLAQIKALLRRAGDFSASAGAPTSGTAFEVGPFRLDMNRGKIFREGKEISLSPKEFDLAVYLMRNANAAVSREKLLAEVWGAFSEVEPQTVAVHMSWLRNKLEDDPAHPQFFKTIRGKGYMFEGGQNV